MSKYILEFYRAHARVGKHSMTVLLSVLACKLPYSSYRCQRANDGTCNDATKLDYSTIKSSLKRTFNDNPSASSCSTGPLLKKEPVFVVSDENEKPKETAFWVHKRLNKTWQYQRGRGRGNFKNAGRNQVVTKGKVTTCAICGSRSHYARKCPDNPENSIQEPGKKELKISENDEDVYLTFASLPGELAKKRLGNAILDTGCTTSVAGKEWFLDYLSKLNALERKSMTKNAS